MLTFDAYPRPGTASTVEVTDLRLSHAITPSKTITPVGKDPVILPIRLIMGNLPGGEKPFGL